MKLLVKLSTKDATKVDIGFGGSRHDIGSFSGPNTYRNI
jgi:hypothetical protein